MEESVEGLPMTVRATNKSTSLRSRETCQSVVLRSWIWPTGLPQVTCHHVVRVRWKRDRNRPSGHPVSRRELRGRKQIQESKLVRCERTQVALTCTTVRHRPVDCLEPPFIFKLSLFSPVKVLPFHPCSLFLSLRGLWAFI